MFFIRTPGGCSSDTERVDEGLLRSAAEEQKYFRASDPAGENGVQAAPDTGSVGWKASC